MVADCSVFIDGITCGLSYTNLYNIKITALTILVIYSLFIYYILSNKDKKWREQSYMHFWAFWLGKVLSILYLVFTPLLLTLLLDHSINLEIFLTIIISFYLVLTALFIGMSIYIGSSNIWRMFGFDDWNEMKDTIKDNRSMKKYG